jgi:hypothetical protein
MAHGFSRPTFDELELEVIGIESIASEEHPLGE